MNIYMEIRKAKDDAKQARAEVAALMAKLIERGIIEPETEAEPDEPEEVTEDG